jgi:succinate-semialdehyde dehydrogenase/glutarate-semialdehyde dehydrogenase
VIESHNPATGAVVDTHDTPDEAAVEAAPETAWATFQQWRDRPLRERERLLADAAEVLRADRDRFARVMTAEMGKPLDQARSEVEKCAWLCEHYAEHAGAYLADEVHPSEPGADVRTVYEPLGPVLAVMPWNFPLWQVFRFAAPALTAGNVALLKHAPSVPGCAAVVTEVFERAGYPDGAVTDLTVEADRVPEVVTTLLSDDRVRAATLTGSGPAGRALASEAGAKLKKTVLELGGSDPFVVLEDADLAAAVEAGTTARTLNGGQSCIAAKRFLVHEAVYDDFLDRLCDRFEALTVGDPTDPATDVGPLAGPDHRDRLAEQVQTTLAAGARAPVGATPLDRPGAFYPPTVLADVPDGCPASDEELFGPVAAVFEVGDERAAVERANATDFGLGASVWTADRERGRRVAGELAAGYVAVNQVTKSDPRVPFGGVKRSGYGRELGRAGIREFLNRKTVWVE